MSTNALWIKEHTYAKWIHLIYVTLRKTNLRGNCTNPTPSPLRRKDMEKENGVTTIIGVALEF